MPNLLPEQSKKKLRLEYRLRLVVVGLIFALIGTATGLAFLLPSYVLLRTEYQERLKKKEEVVGVVKVAQGDNYLNALADTNAKVAVLAASKGSSSVLMLIKEVVDQRVAGIQISTFDYSRDINGTGRLTLTGKAATRDVLISFKNNLQTLKNFTKVDHSITDLIKAENIAFTLNISGKF